MKFSWFAAALCLSALVSLSACTKEASGPPVPASSPRTQTATADKPIVVDQKMMEATRQIEEDAAQAAAALKKAAAGTTEKSLRFSGIPNQNTTELNAKYKLLADFLGAKLGVPFEYVPSVDYNASVDGFKNGDLLLCWFGGVTGVQARAAVPGARAIACGPRDMKFKSYFIAHQGLGLAKSKDFPLALRGKSFTFGSPQSTSGRLMPEHFIRQFAKQSPKEFFGAEPSFTKGHDQTLELVAGRAFEAGVVDYTVYEKRVKEGKIDPAVVVVVWESPEYCDYQFTAHPELDRMFGAGFTDRLQKALISIEGDDRKLLGALDREDGGLIACRNEDFDTLKGVALEIGLVR